MLLVIKMKNFKNSVDNKLCGSAKAVLCPNCCQSGCLKPFPFLSFPGCSSPPQTSVKLFFPIILSFTCRYWIPGLWQFLRTQYTGPATDRIFFSHFAELFPKVLYLLELYLPVKWKQHTSPNDTSSMLSFSLKCMMGEGFNTKHFSGREGLEHKGCSPASAWLRMLEERRTGVGSVKA